MNRLLQKHGFICPTQILFFLMIFFLVAGCSQSQVNQDKTNGNTSIVKEETESSLDVEVIEDEDAEFEEMDEFEEEFGDATQEEVFDPLEGYNRAMTTFNDKLYYWVLKPVAQCYRWIVPECVRRGIDRFFTNLMYPVRFVNNVLQFKIKNAGEETLRFVTNTTVGVLGFWDPAKDWFGLEAHEEDFGQTLGVYGVGAGPHIVLPFFGPSNLRDALSMYPDTKYLDPKTRYLETTEQQVGAVVFEKVNNASLRIGEYESVQKDALDFYIFMRDGYEQIRKKEIEE